MIHHLIRSIEGRCPVCSRRVTTYEIAACDTERSLFDVEFHAECMPCGLLQRKSLPVLYVAEKGHVPSQDVVISFARVGFSEPVLQDSMTLWGVEGEVFGDV